MKYEGKRLSMGVAEEICEEAPQKERYKFDFGEMQRLHEKIKEKIKKGEKVILNTKQ